MNDRVLRMNTASADQLETVPFPAQQQLGVRSTLEHKFDLIAEAELGNFDASGGHGILPVRQRIRLEDPIHSDGKPGVVEPHNPDALQREVPGRNARSISASQSSPTVPGRRANQTTSAGGSASASDGAGVPDGSVGDVLAWVGDDSSRARAALEVENKKSSPRQSLIKQLNDKI